MQALEAAGEAVHDVPGPGDPGAMGVLPPAQAVEVASQDVSVPVPVQVARSDHGAVRGVRVHGIELPGGGGAVLVLFAFLARQRLGGWPSTWAARR